ncbi:MAG: 2OG-Fe(II) oxygenase, partial [Proteobacteria bacterium]|nr:2OG-Fe(II) oxygenase [Pseudomonadota bacterium]
GHFIAHRDDTTPYSAHRRFAMSLALSTGDYEGGYVRFPEYGPQLFRAETGSAVVFSVSMLHEVTKITAGRRFILLGFFYSEAEEALRQEVHAERRAAEADSSA